MPQRQGPTRRIEQLRRELEAERVLAAPEPDGTPAEPAWKSSTQSNGLERKMGQMPCRENTRPSGSDGRASSQPAMP
jgi:hypothetical protein